MEEESYSTDANERSVNFVPRAIRKIDEVLALQIDTEPFSVRENNRSSRFLKANMGTPVRVGAGRDSCTLFIRLQAQKACPALAAIPPNACLPTTSTRAFRCILRYLDGNRSLNYMRPYGSFQVHLVKTWALAGQLGLPRLQNELISYIRRMYLHAKKSRISFEFESEAFEFLRDTKGCQRMEDFLIEFHVGLCLDKGRLLLQFQHCGAVTAAKAVTIFEEHEAGYDGIELDFEQFWVKPQNGSIRQVAPETYHVLQVENPNALHGSGSGCLRPRYSGGTLREDKNSTQQLAETKPPAGVCGTKTPPEFSAGRTVT